MNRTLSVKRIYNLGNYQNLELHDAITEIPQEVMLNKDLLTEIRILQFIQLELDYREYATIFSEANKPDFQDQIEALVRLREIKFDEFIKHLKETEKGES